MLQIIQDIFDFLFRQHAMLPAHTLFGFITFGLPAGEMAIEDIVTTDRTCGPICEIHILLSHPTGIALETVIL
jgi:hypothetical protein